MVAFSRACVLQVIESLPCQVSLDEARQFAERFDPAYQLTGEMVDPPLQKSQQRKARSARSAHAPDHSQKKEKVKHKEKKKRRKKRKAT